MRGNRIVSSAPTGDLFPPRPIPFLSVYTLNSSLQDQDTLVLRGETFGIFLKTGPFKISRAMPIRQATPQGAVIMMGREELHLAEGRYLVVRTDRSLENDPEAYASASLEVAEISAKIALLFPWLLAERKFEGFAATEGQLAFACPGVI
ncbi:MAG: hypothetical protein ACREMU_04400, partial [Gemmatimonadaceae bacterium]